MPDLIEQNNQNSTLSSIQQNQLKNGQNLNRLKHLSEIRETYFEDT
jgi:hypothetical protein